MRPSSLAFIAVLAVQAHASPAQVLDSNKAATGGSAWDGKVTLRLDYGYSGQGLTGTTSSLEDLKRGAFVDSYSIGPQNGATGYDGDRAWEKEPSGTVTWQSGGDVVPLAISEAYQDRNLWWRADRGGAAIKDDGSKTENGAVYDVLTVTPKGGKPFDAWFDGKTHLLYRTIEVQGTLTTQQTYSDYAPVDGVQIARKIVIDDGSHNLQTLTLKLARFSAALPASAYGPPKEDIHDFSIAGGARSATVPFRLINNHIYVDVSVNGSKPLLFMFDTGGHSILQPEAAKMLHVASEGHQSATGGGDKVVESGVAVVKTFRIGAVTFSDQPVAVLAFDSKKVEGIQDYGMLGYELFARFVTRFDYGNHTVTFFDKRYFDAKDAGTAVPMALYHQFPEVHGTFDGVAGRFGIDTGSRFALMLTAPFAAEHDLRAKVSKGIEAAIGWGVGGPSRGFVFRQGMLTLGDVKIASPLAEISTDKGGAAAAAAFPNNIGGGILKRFVVTFDYQHSIMYLKPVKGPVADLDTFDRSGMWLNEGDGGYKIFDLDDGAPAAEAGLQKGDVIVSIDGKPASDIPLYVLREKLRNDPPGTKVDVKFERRGKYQNATITLKDLI